MAINEFLTFADAVDADVMPQADYEVLAARSSGFQSGKANSLQLNKVWRQSSFVASAVAQLIPDILGLDALDDTDFATFLTNLKGALGQIGSISRTIIAAGPQDILATDANVFINQTVAAAITLNLPATPSENQEVTIFDDKGDSALYNITVDGNGNAINDLVGDQYIIAVNYKAVTFKFNGTAWRIKCVNM